MTKKIFLAILLLIAALLLFVAGKPDDFRVTREITIVAPPSEVFRHVNDPREFQKWSPWAKMDPQTQVTYEGPAAGVGSSFTWKSGKTGEGTMALTESRQDEFIRFMLAFRKPFEASNTADFTFTPEGSTTRVTWSMYGKSNFLSKAIGVFVSMDKMLGKNFEQGLADLKILSETKP